MNENDDNPGTGAAQERLTVAAVVDRAGGAGRVAAELGIPVGTVADWAAGARVPEAWRPALLRLASRGRGADRTPPPPTALEDDPVPAAAPASPDAQANIPPPDSEAPQASTAGPDGETRETGEATPGLDLPTGIPPHDPEILPVTVAVPELEEDEEPDGPAAGTDLPAHGPPPAAGPEPEEPEVTPDDRAATPDLPPHPPETLPATAAGADGEAGETTGGPRLVTDNEGLVATGLGKRFRQRPVLRGISISVQRGEIVGLLGPNGAGKTTCFYIITGLISADYGTITLDGRDITSLPMYRRARLGIGYLPQEPSIFRGLSVEQNIRAVLEVVEKDRSRREERLDELLAEFSITHLRRSPATALSGGERRRVEIARALASQPNFILLDEPLAGIDPIALNDIRELVIHLRDRGIGVLITDHNVRETLDVVDRAYIIHNGVVLMAGQPADIVNHEDVRRFYLGDRFSL